MISPVCFLLSSQNRKWVKNPKPSVAPLIQSEAINRYHCCFLVGWLNDHLLFIRVTVRVFPERLSVCVCASFSFCVEGEMTDLIVLVPDYCL